MGSEEHKKSMGSRSHPFVVFAAVAAIGAVAYGAAVAYPVERSEEDVVRVSPQRSVLLGELPRRKPTPISFVSVDSVEGLQQAFDAADFRLSPIRRGHETVPRLLLAELPADFSEIDQVAERKRLFFKTMLPLVLRVNEEITAERRRLVGLITIIEAGHDLKPADRLWLERLSERYRTNPGEFATLLRRVDAVSPALAMAQSIEESGWGRSRFARNGNALFGQRVWAEGAGIVPKQRADGQTFEVRAFERLIDSVRAYALNLNRHPAYADYRIERARQRATEVALDPYALAETLVEYSERREQYVETLHSIIRSNKLDQFEIARLEPKPYRPLRTFEISSSR